MNKMRGNQSFGMIGVSNPPSRDVASSKGEDETFELSLALEPLFLHPKRHKMAKIAEKIIINAFFIAYLHAFFFCMRLLYNILPLFSRGKSHTTK